MFPSSFGFVVPTRICHRAEGSRGVVVCGWDRWVKVVKGRGGKGSGWYSKVVSVVVDEQRGGILLLVMHGC